MGGILENIRKTDWIPVAVLTAVSVALLGHMVHYNPNWFADTFLRLSPLHDLVAGDGYFANPRAHLAQPLYGIFSYIAYQLTGDVEFGAMMVSVVATVLLTPAAFFATHLFFDRRVALLTALFVALGPEFIRHGHHTLAESTFGLLLLLGFINHSLLVLNGPTRSRCIAHGVLLALLWLTRAEGVLPGVLSCLFLLGMLGLHLIKGSVWPQIDKKKAAKYIFVFVFVYMLSMAPWLVALRVVSGHWQIGKGNAPDHGALSERYAAPGVVIPFDRQVDYMKDNVGFLVNLFKNNARMLMTKLIVNLRHALAPLLILAVLSLFFQTRAVLSVQHWSKQKMLFLLSVLIFVSPVPVILIYMVLDRYFLPYLPFVLMIVAYLTVRFVDSMPVRPHLLWSLVLAVFLIHLTLPVPGVPYRPDLTRLLEFRGTSRQGIRGAGLWMEANCHFSHNLRLIVQVTCKRLSFTPVASAFGS